jgi:hypothetical protein
MWNTPTREELDQIPRLYATEKVPMPEKLIYLHFFIHNCDWYIAEYDGKDMFWGFAILGGDLVNAEWGYIPFDNLKISGFAGFEVDRDINWKVRPAREVDKIRLAWCHSHWKKVDPELFPAKQEKAEAEG